MAGHHQRLASLSVRGNALHSLLLPALALLLLILSARTSWTADTNTLATTFEQIAKTNRHFSHTVIIDKCALRLPSSGLGEKDAALYRSWAISQLVLLKQFKNFSKQREELIALLKSENPKVRTLALGALFQRGEARDLPLIASFLEDRSPTFPDLHAETGSSGHMPSAADQAEPQSMAAIASAMLLRWGVPASEKAENRKWLVTEENFEKWTKASNRQPEDSTDPLKIPRYSYYHYPSDEIGPDLALYQADTKQVLADLQTLPAYARAWTTYHVYRNSFGDYFDMTALSQAVFTAFRDLGREEVIRILNYGPYDKLPEIQPPFSESFKDDPMKARCFRRIEEASKLWAADASSIQGFILSHARELLLPIDVSFLLTKEKRRGSFGDSLWEVAAAELAHWRSPAESRLIINLALSRYSIKGSFDSSERAGLRAVLWRTEGMKASSELIEWFYDASDSDYGQYYFLGYIERAARPDTRELLAAITADKRFDQTTLLVVGEFLEMINRDLPIMPLVPQKEIEDYGYKSRHGIGFPSTLEDWRARLRQHFSQAVKRPQP